MKPLKLNQFVVTGTALLLTICIVTAVTTFADYEIDWHTIDGGGGISSSGQYIVTGTIAQHDAAYSESEKYELLGGFWPGGPLCVVSFEHFARFAEYWLETGEELPADLYKDEYDIVDYLDLNIFADEWLYYCPYNWPFK
ncbi:MAG: hypothetical protein ABIG61_02945 [Planctomycetota bacterium]